MIDRPKNLWESFQRMPLPKRPRKGQVLAFGIPDATIMGKAEIPRILGLTMNDQDTLAEITRRKFMRLNGSIIKRADLQEFISRDLKGEIKYVEEGVM